MVTVDHCTKKTATSVRKFELTVLVGTQTTNPLTTSRVCRDPGGRCVEFHDVALTSLTPVFVGAAMTRMMRDTRNQLRDHPHLKDVAGVLSASMKKLVISSDNAILV